MKSLTHLVKKSFVRQTPKNKGFINQLQRWANYGTEPIREGQYVSQDPPLTVPDHIIRPDFVGNPNPEFGVYDGPPVVHNLEFQNKLRIAGKTASNVLKYMTEQVKEGMTTNDLDKLCHDYIIEQGAYPTPLGFMYFPKSVCTSVNEVCCHGIPDNRVLKNGDYINIDVSLFIEGVHGDNSAMVCVGEVHPDVKKVIDVTQKALYESIKICRPGTPFQDIGAVCQQIATENGIIVNELFTGHGIGEKLHMPPTIFHQKNDYPFVMEPGNVFTIEPIFMLKPGPYYMWRDNFTVVSPNNPSAQWEHTIIINDDGYEVITQREGEFIE